jgi:hypothetical protein
MGRYQQFIVSGVSDIKLVTGDKSTLDLVFTQFVTELHGRPELAFLDRVSFGIKKI